MSLKIKTILLSVFAIAVLLESMGGAKRVFASSSCVQSLPEDICQIEDKVYRETDFKNTDQVRQVVVALKQLMITHQGDPQMIRDQLLGLFEEVIEECHKVRAPSDILVQADGQPNLLSVYDKVLDFEKKHGQIVPVDWTLPDGLKYFVITASREYSPVKDHTAYDFGIYGILKDEKTVEQLQVIRYPNEVILDRQAGIGSWNDEHLGSNQTPSFSFSASNHSTPMPEGLYLIHIKMQNQPMVKGWFVLDQTSVSSSPVVRSPSANEVLHTGNPTLRWVDYQSREYRGFEQRKRKLSIYTRGQGPNRRVWSSFVIDSGHSDSVLLSEAPNLEGMKELPSGHYAFKANFEERWFFGGFLVGRSTLTEVPFKVSP